MYGPRPGCLPALRGTDKQKKKGGGGARRDDTGQSVVSVCLVPCYSIVSHQGGILRSRKTDFPR